jgi:hypothetical protein
MYRKTHEAELHDALREYFRRQQASVLTRIKQHPLDKDFRPFIMAEWNKRLRAIVSPLIAKAFNAAAERVRDSIDVDEFDENSRFCVQWLESRTQSMVRQINDETWNAVQSLIMPADDDAHNVSETIRVYYQSTEKRSATIALRETMAAMNAGGLEAARQSGRIASQRWCSDLSDGHQDMHGKIVGLNEDFHNAPLTPNCRCIVLFEKR